MEYWIKPFLTLGILGTYFTPTLHAMRTSKVIGL
jgi:hypothetical protein